MVKSKSSKSRKTVTSTASAKAARGGRSVHAQDLETPDLLHPDNDTLSEDNTARRGGEVDARTDGTDGADDTRVVDRNVINDMGSVTATV